MKQIYISIILFLLIVRTSTAQLTTTRGNLPAALVDTLVGTGVTITNIVYTGNANSKGTYKCIGGCNLGSPRGIFLTSGDAAPGGNSPASSFHSTDMGTGGDTQLDALLSPPDFTTDAAVLEFDFTAATDSVQFKYVFGSEEYNDYVNSFNDAFAFFISGPGIPGGTKNIAIVPGTNTPVTIDNVNNGYAAAGSAGAGPCTNCAYYHDNVLGGSGSIFFDGFTVPMVAGIRVMPCETYHMKFVVADVNDHVFDTGVFLQANSFSSLGQIQIYANGQPQANSDTVLVCTGDSVTLTINPASHYLWSNGDTTQSIVVTQANLAPGGNYSCVIANPLVACFAWTTFIKVMFVNPVATITTSGPTALCPGGSVTLTSSIANSYLWSNGATTQSINVNTAGTYTVTVTNVPSCNSVSAPVVITMANPAASVTGTTSICAGQSTTLTATAGASYLWSTGATTQSITPTTSNTYTVTVTFAGGCTASGSSVVTVNPLPSTTITGINSICQGASTTLNAGAGFSGYLWSTGATTATINTGIAGPYTVTVTGAGGCSSTATRSVTVNPLPTPAITGTTTFCQGNNSTLNAGGGYANYLWSTGATTQTLNVTASSNYIVTVTDANGCSKSTNAVVTVNANPAPSITGPLAFCAGNSTTLNAGAGYTNYLWSNGALTQTISPAGANNYTVTVTNANGCTGTASAATVVNPLPAPVITGISSICQNTVSALNAGSGYSSYLWSTGAVTPAINANATGTYTVTVTDANTCSKSASFNLTVNPLPLPSITGVTAFCQGGSSTLNAGGGFSSYLWSTGAVTQTLPVSTQANYTVTVTNGFGCTASVTQFVTVHALPNPVITGANGICAGSTATLNAGSGYTTYLWSTGATTATISPSAANTYSVTVTNANACSASTSKVLTTFALPVPAITGNNVVCQGINSTFDAGAGYAHYLWSTGAATQTIAVNTANAFSVTVTDANGCSNTTSRTLTVNPVPSTTITGTTAFCQGNSSTLDGGAGFNSYLWTPGGATTRSINVTTGGSYTVTVTNNFSCSSSAAATVTVHGLPTPAITGPAGICSGSNATINAGNSYSTYAWSTGATTAGVTLTGAGTYTVTVTDANGCTGNAYKTLTIFPLPAPAITGNAAVCQGSTSLLQAGTFTSYLWSTGATTATINAGVAGSYTVTVMDANSCSKATSFNLTVNALPTPAITGVSAFCNGASSILNAGSGYAGYLWSTGATTPTLSVTMANTYKVTVTDGNGCTAMATQPITVWALPNPVITGTAAICAGTQSTLSAGTFASYQWSNAATTPTISVGAALPYLVTVTDGNGCANTSSPFNLTVRTLPTAVISNNSTICKGKSTTITVNLTGTAPYHYTYDNGTTTVGPVTSTTATATIPVAPQATATYTLTQVNDAYCAGTFSGAATVTVNALPTPVITGLDEICDGATATLSAGSYAGYVWSTGETTSGIAVATTGLYACTVTDGNGCKNATTHLFTVNETPVITFTNDTSLTCEAPIIHFRNTSSYPAGSLFNWDFADGALSGEESPAHQFSQPGNFPITLTITSLKGCTATATNNLDIIFYPLPVAKFAADPKETSMFNSLVNLVDQSENAVTWKWDLGDGNIDSVQNLKHYYHEPSRYTIKLTVTNIAGCVSETHDEIMIAPFFIPSAFTPNSDGKNELFFEPGFDLDVQSFNMKVFNRWGQMVFATDSYKNGWDGYDNKGKPASSGVYTYVLKVVTHTGKDFKYNGSVTLLR